MRANPIENRLISSLDRRVFDPPVRRPIHEPCSCDYCVEKAARIWRRQAAADRVLRRRREARFLKSLGDAIFPGMNA